MPRPVKPTEFHGWVHNYGAKIFFGIAMILAIVMITNMIFSGDRTSTSAMAKAVYYVHAGVAVVGALTTVALGLASLIPQKAQAPPEPDYESVNYE